MYLRIPMSCPCCGKRLNDTEDTVTSKTLPVAEMQLPKYSRWIPDYYVKCWNCKNDIAIKKVG